MRCGAPTVHEDPRDGAGASTGLYYCMKCVEWGVCTPPEDTYPNPPIENSRRETPCTICAMANGGRWGWKEGHKGDINHTLKTNGYFPGFSCIEDVLNNHSSEPEPWWDVTDEETILGFVQNGLYQHYKWNEIIDIGEGLSRLRPMLPPTSYLQNKDDLGVESDRYQNNWYWWKIIPYHVVLPKRLIKVLKEILSSYCEESIPTTRQRPHESDYDENSWEYFFETYIEPSHVIHVFTKVLEKVLESNKENFNGRSTITTYNIYTQGNIPNSIIPLYDHQSSSWLAQSNSILDEIGSDIRWSDGSSRIHFLVYGTGELYIGSELPRGQHLAKRVLRILDRDIFGSTLTEVIEYDWARTTSWNRDTSILQTYERQPSTEELCELWNIDDWKILYDDAMKMITFEETLTNYHPMDSEYTSSDYDHEYFIRRDIIGYSDSDSDSDSGSDSGSDSDSDSTRLSKDIIHYLQDIQELIDEEVKEKVQENTYIELQNKLRDIYRIIK